MGEWWLQTKSQSTVFWSKILYVFVIGPVHTPANLVLFRFITLLVFIEAPHHAVLSILLLPLLHVSKIHLFDLAPCSSSFGSLSATRNQRAPLLSTTLSRDSEYCCLSEQNPVRKNPQKFVVFAFGGPPDPRGASRREVCGFLIHAIAPFSDSVCIFPSGYKTTFGTHTKKKGGEIVVWYVYFYIIVSHCRPVLTMPGKRIFTAKASEVTTAWLALTFSFDLNDFVTWIFICRYKRLHAFAAM